MRIAALMTSFNRREKTLTSLKCLVNQEVDSSIELDVFLVDAGSNDGTAEAVKTAFPHVNLILATEDIYWNRGMNIAFCHASKSNPSYFLWLNDDTLLVEDAVTRLLETETRQRELGHNPGIIVGSVADPKSGDITYGGLTVVSKVNRLKHQLNRDLSAPVRLDTMNGNCVLIANNSALKVGNLDWSFVHSMGDIDYGFRASKAGVEIWSCPGAVGTCERNSSCGTWEDQTLDIRQRFSKLTGPKGLPVRSWSCLAYRHAGPLWPLILVSPYLKVLIGGAKGYFKN